jgi:hypothetical protein
MPLDEIKQAAHIRLFSIQLIKAKLHRQVCDGYKFLLLLSKRVSSWIATTVKLQLREMRFQVANHSPEMRRKSTGGASVA